jgi:AraC-like DNA-binding protein
MLLSHPELAPLDAGQSLRVLVWDQDLVDMWCLDASGRRMPFQGRGSTWHHHPECELTLISQGEGLLQVGDHIGRFRAPDCLLLGGQLPHVWRSRAPMAGLSVQFHADRRVGLGRMPEVAALGELWAKARQGIRWQGGTADALAAQLPRLEHITALARLGAVLALLELLQEAPVHDAVRLAQHPVDPERPLRTGSRMDRVFDHLMEHFREELRLEDLVALSGLSQATFCRHFHRHAGKSLVAYLHALRVQEASHLLQAGQDSVTAIAFQVGFNNLSHFHAVFQRLIGTTPRAYRRQQAEGG